MDVKLTVDQSENELLDELIKEQFILQLRALNQRLNDFEHGPSRKLDSYSNRQNSSNNINSELRRLEALILSVNERAGRMRIDRQMFEGIRLIKSKSTERYHSYIQKKRRSREKVKIDKIMSLITDNLLICPIYPGGARKYGGEFIQKRVEAYKKNGIDVTVLEVSANTRELEDGNVNNVRVVRLNPSGLNKFLKRCHFNQILVHQLEALIWKEIKTYVDDVPIIVWVHGFEARRWQELAENYSEKFLSEKLDMLNRLNETRQGVMREIFEHGSIKTVFVSSFMKNIAQSFAQVTPKNPSVIHNSISTYDFPFKKKKPADRHKILWIRSFAAHNYANDISRDVILAMSKKPDFQKYSFSIFGDGLLFDETVEPLQKFKNVRIEKRFLSTGEISEQHSKHGLMLVPTRWDSQGLTCGEAMSSGLVPLTTKTAAIPEFMDETCAIFDRKNMFKGLVDGIIYVDQNPEEFIKMSNIAAKRSQEQCGIHATIDQEIRLISHSIKK